MIHEENCKQKNAWMSLPRIESSIKGAADGT